MRGSALSRGRPGVNQASRNARRSQVKLDELAGDRGRGNNHEMAAIRKKDLAGIPLDAMRSIQISAAPTMDEYNALQADVAGIHKALSTLLGKGEY